MLSGERAGEIFTAVRAVVLQMGKDAKPNDEVRVPEYIERVVRGTQDFMRRIGKPVSREHVLEAWLGRILLATFIKTNTALPDA